MSKRHKVMITDLITKDLEPELEILGDVADLVPLGANSEEELVGRIEDADAIMLYHCLSITKLTLDRLKNCKLIVRGGIGIDNVDHIHARKCGIPVANVPDYGTEEVADSAIGMMLTLTRGIAHLNSLLRGNLGPWTYQLALPHQRLRGKVLGIVGFGRIGTAVALRGKAIGMDVAFYDPYIPDGKEKSIGVRRVTDLRELIEQAHVLTMHCPLTEETHHMIDAEAIAALPPGSFLINTSRGGVVDTDAIPDAIASEHLFGAVIDVLEIEPPADDNKLIAAWRDPAHLAHHRVLVNPHSAFYCVQGELDIRTKAATACRCAVLGEPVRNVVN